MRQKEKVTTQHMADRKKTHHTMGKVTTEMYGAPKSYSTPKNKPTVEKEKTQSSG
jgi:hypothetical protein